MSTKLPKEWIELTCDNGDPIALDTCFINVVTPYSGDKINACCALSISGIEQILYVKETYENVMAKMVKAMEE